MSPVRLRSNVSVLSEDQRLWRYFDLEGALNILRTNNLRLTQLAEFDDGYEGLQSPAERERDELLNTPESLHSSNFDRDSMNLFEVFNRFHTYASCWTSVSPNSMMMWSIYAPEPNSIAIETTVGSLLNSLPETGPELILGALEYGDRVQDVSELYNPLDAIWKKWNYYAHEQEVRLNVNANNFGESHDSRCSCQEPKFKSVELRPDTFSRVYAHPKMKEEVFQGLSSLIESHINGRRLERTAIRVSPPTI